MKTLIIISKSEFYYIKEIIEYINKRLRKSIYIFDTEEFVLSKNKLHFYLLENGEIDGVLECDCFSTEGEKKEMVKISDISIAWALRYKRIWGNKDFSKIEQLISNQTISTLESLFSILKVKWINHPFQNRILDQNKVLQMLIAYECGLNIPNSFISNSKNELEIVFQNENEIAIKQISSSIVKKNNKYHGSYTRKISINDLLLLSEKSISSCPNLFQNYIEKDFELRITVVGEKVFACKIDSQISEETKTDWRTYDFGDKNPYSIFQLPKEIKEKILLFMKKSEISFGAIDMIVTPEGEYVFLEINPSGQFDWIAKETEMPIYEAIAEILVGE